MAHASRARGGRRRGILPFRLRRVERVATRALRGGICLLRAHHRVCIRGGGASERGVARAAWCRGRLRDAVHATLPRLQRARPGRLLSAAARWLFDGLRPERVTSGVWHLHLRHMGDSRRVRPRRARLYHLNTGRTARRYLLADARASVSSENGRSGSGVLTEAAATSVAPLVALFFAWSAWPSENLSGVHLASLAVAMALVHLLAYAIVANKALLSSSSSVAGASRGRQGNVSGQAYSGFFEVSALAGLLEDRSTETSRESYGEPSRESGISLALRYARTQAFAAFILLTLAVVFLLDGEALASALAVEGALLAYLVRPAESDDAVMKLAGRRLIAAKSWLLLAFAALYSLGAVAWRATNPFGATGTGGDAAYLPFLNGDTVSLLAVVASLFFVGRMGEGADASDRKS